MDPLSICASVITLIGAGGELSKLLKRLVNLRNSPSVLEGLYHEISEIQLLVGAVDDTLQAAVQDRLYPPTNLISSLERIKVTLLRLEKFISYELTAPTVAGADFRVDKSVFMRTEGRIQKFRDEIYTNKTELSLALNLFLCSLQVRTQPQLRQISRSLELLLGRVDNVPALTSRIHEVPQQDPPLPTVNQTAGTIYGLHNVLPEVRGESEDSIRRLNNDSPKQSHDHGSSLVDSSQSKGREEHHDGTIIRPSQGPCDVDCPCSCHSYIQIESPRPLSNIFGSLFIAFRESAFSKQAHTSTQCQAHATKSTFFYAFPPWLLERAISITYSSILAQGPELLLRVMRMRAHHQIVRRDPQSWAVVRVKGMLDTGQASVLDINSYGFTLLHMAIKDQMWDVALLLISYGAEMNLVNHKLKNQTSPFVDAFLERWRLGMLSSGTDDRLDRLLLQDSSQFDIFGFSDLHKAYVGRSGFTFDQVLASTQRSDVDKSDRQGRTLLFWAAARGDSRTVARILTCGAEVNKADLVGYRPLHEAVRRDTATAELLLAAKADVNATSHFGTTPLHYVSQNTTSIIRQMVDLGADIEKRDIIGRTPLAHASMNDRSNAVEELLACGASFHARTIHGCTPICFAIIYNCHQTLPILISNLSLQHEIEEDVNWSVFRTAAMFASIQTLNILRTQWPTGINLESKLERLSIEDWAKFRRDCNERWSENACLAPDDDPKAWYEAFLDMVDTIFERQKNVSELELEVWEDATEHLEVLCLIEDTPGSKAHQSD